MKDCDCAVDVRQSLQLTVRLIGTRRMRAACAIVAAARWLCRRLGVTVKVSI